MSSTTNQNPGCLTFFRSLFGGNRQQEAAPPESLPYRIRDDFLSPAEFSFYRLLASVAGAHVTICAKVRLADILYVARPNENAGYYNRIASKHVDYLLCDSVTMKPLVAIELDDTSHNRSKRKERDEFVDKAFQAARLPLLHFIAQREYNPREVMAQVAPFLKDTAKLSAKSQTSNAPQPVTATASGSTAAAPLCPKCGIPMVVRTVAQGEHKGKQFYGCQNYPRCREMKPVAQSKRAG